MHPILFKIGWFHLPTYGVLLVLALLAAIVTVGRLGRREGLDPNRVLDFSTWLIVVGLVGAKLLMFVTDPGYLQNPGQIFTWGTIEAGGVFYGGFIAAVIFAVWYVHVHRLPLLKVFDVYAPAIALGQSVGRLGCFSAGCDYGKESHSFLAVVFTSPYAHEITGVPLNRPIYPTQVLESLATFIIFGILLWRYRHKTRDGQIFLLYLTLYAVARFFLEFLRGDADRGFVFNGLLSTSQFIAILAVAAASGLWLYLRRRPRAEAGSAAPAAGRRQKVGGPARHSA